MQALSWLASSSAEIARARNVLKGLQPTGVIDELGFLVLQGAFADRFYPAVVTPMTRARYLILVPAIYQHLEQSRNAIGKDVDRLARDLQFQLLERVRTEPGAIGKDRGRAIIRPPSEVYWSALAVLGLATQRTSLATYQRRISEGAFRRRSVRDDDDAVHPEDVQSLWDPAIRASSLLENGEFPDGTTLLLRKAEARLLRERYAALRPSGHRTLITHLVDLAQAQNLTTLEAIDYPWDIPGLPDATAHVVRHARCLSLFARGTTLQYHQMLLERKGLDASGPGDAFVEWWEGAHDALAKWDLEQFFAIVSGWDADKRPVADRAFLRNWVARCAKGRTGKVVLEDTDARAAIAEREDRVRPGKQRLRVKYQLESFQGEANYNARGLYQLDYRHRVGRQFAQDILEGLGSGKS
jgi:hypothetical protein